MFDRLLEDFGQFDDCCQAFGPHWEARLLSQEAQPAKKRYWLLTRWELDFVATVARYTKPPSVKQMVILQRLVARCRKAAA